MIEPTIWLRESRSEGVVVSAAPFGLGPRVSADDAIEALSLDLGPWRLVRMSTLSGRRIRHLLDFGGSGSNWPPVKPEVRIWVDCLLWARRRLPPGVDSADLVIAERFFASNSAAASQARRFEEARPPVGSARRSNRGKRHGVIVSFGGVLTPYSDVDRVASGLAAALTAVQSAVGQHERITCLLPEPIGSAVRERAGDSATSIVTGLNHDQVSERIAMAKIAVLQPGLYGPFASLIEGTPVCFVPPFSYTQHRQLLRFADEVPMFRLPAMDALEGVPGPPPEDFEEESEWTARLERWWQVESPTLMRVLAKRVASTLTQTRQHASLAWCPPDWTRLPTVAEIVASWIGRP